MSCVAHIKRVLRFIVLVFEMFKYIIFNYLIDLGRKRFELFSLLCLGTGVTQMNTGYIKANKLRDNNDEQKWKKSRSDSRFSTLFFTPFCFILLWI